MPEPIPSPTATQLVTVGDIIRESVSVVEEAVAADDDQDISNAKWALTLTDISTWNAAFTPGKRQTKKVGPIEWYQGSESLELDFVNRVRRRYGFDALAGLRTSELNPSSLAWF